MKAIRTRFATAALAGLVLVTPFPTAHAGNAVSLPQAGAKPCGTVTVAAASDLTYALYAVGKIVLWTRKDSRVDVGKGFSALRDAAVRKIAIANPEHAPYGRAAEEALRRAGVYDAVKDRLVLGENISQASQFVESGNADAGILALSLALAPGLAEKGRYWNIPEKLYAPIQQGVVIVRGSPNPQGARQFLDYIKMPATAALLERYGFVLPAKISTGGRP
jgi:molybdate transport system substrate-binding protein